MAEIRIEKSSITVIETADPLVVWVECDVTTDDEKTEYPAFQHVKVLYNKNTPLSDIKKEVKKLVKDNSLQENIRSAIGESIKKQESAK